MYPNIFPVNKRLNLYLVFGFRPLIAYIQNGFYIRAPWQSERSSIFVEFQRDCREICRLEYVESENTRISRCAQKQGESHTNRGGTRRGMERARRVAGNNLLHPTTCCTPLKILHASPSNFTVNCLFGKKSLSFSVFFLSLFPSPLLYVSHWMWGHERSGKIWSAMRARSIANRKNWEEVNKGK